MDGSKVVSPSRTYVAVCNKGNWDGHYFRKFRVPETIDDVPEFYRCYTACQTSNLKNNAEYASWYFLNVIDAVACIDGCVTWEDFNDVKDVTPFSQIKLDLFQMRIVASLLKSGLKIDAVRYIRHLELPGRPGLKECKDFIDRVNVNEVLLANQVL